MGKIISESEIRALSEQIKESGGKIVVTGGCFDILHLGHIEFLKKAKASGDVLFLLLESDNSVRNKKGKKRPINSQQIRAKILSSLSSVDYIVPLKDVTNNDYYDTLIASIKPDIFAVTENDPGLIHKERQAKKVGGKIKPVISRIENISSSRLAELLEE